METKALRKSNIELLRIISMLLIVMSHCDELFGLADLYSTSLGINKIITDWLHIGGQIGVGCFVLISGYFLIDAQFSIKRLIVLAGEVWFYTITSWLIWVVISLFHGNFNLYECIGEIKYTFFPILFSHYWFVSAYFILIILSPFINKFLLSLSRDEYRNFIVVIVVLFVILDGGIPLVFQGISEGRLLPVLLMYIFAGYIKRFVNEKNIGCIKHYICAIICYLLLFLSFYFLTFWGQIRNNGWVLENRYFYRDLNSPLVVLICIELFIGIINTDIRPSKLINEIAKCTFGVYLIHTNRLVSKFLRYCFPIYLEKRSLLIFLYSISAVITIYLGCTLIDLIRRKTIEKVWSNVVANNIKIFEKILSFIERLFVRVL